jgi:SSS family solute:Na+ symporter
MDFYQHFRPDASEKELVLVGRLATTVLVLLGILWVPFIRYISSQIYIYLQSVQAYISPPIAAVFILGILWKRTNGKGAIWALITGAIVGVFRLVIELLHKAGHINSPVLQSIAEVNFLHFAVYLFLISVAVLVVVSLISKKEPKEKIAGLTFDTAKELRTEISIKMDEKNPVWTKVNVGFSVLLIAVVIFLYIQFF